MWLLKFSFKKVIDIIVRHLFSSLLTDSGVLMGLFAFLWFFYSSVADRIFPTANAVLGGSPGIVNPLIYKTTIGDLNWLVLLFPFIFFSLIVLVHHLWGKWRWFGITLGLIFAFDCVVALISSRKVHEYLSQNDPNYEGVWTWVLWESSYSAHIAIVVFCGFGASFAAGVLYHFVKGIVSVPDADNAPDTDIDIEE